MLVNLMPLNFPTGTMWRLLGSSTSKPTKQLEDVVLFMLLSVLVLSEEMLVKGDGGVVAMMFRGTSVRKGWPRARKLVPCRVIGNGEVSSTSSRAFLIRLGGAMES